MIVHVGKVLREVYLSTGLKMAKFKEAVSFSDKTIYYHFGQADLNTSILDQYETGLQRLGLDVDIWNMIARKRRGLDTELPQPIVVAEAAEPYGPAVAELLRRAADLLDKQSKEAGAAPESK